MAEKVPLADDRLSSQANFFLTPFKSLATPPADRRSPPRHSQLVQVASTRNIHRISPESALLRLRLRLLLRPNYHAWLPLLSLFGCPVFLVFFLGVPCFYTVVIRDSELHNYVFQPFEKHKPPHLAPLEMGMKE